MKVFLLRTVEDGNHLEDEYHFNQMGTKMLVSYQGF